MLCLILGDFCWIRKMRKVTATKKKNEEETGRRKENTFLSFVVVFVRLSLLLVLRVSFQFGCCFWALTALPKESEEIVRFCLLSNFFSHFSFFFSISILFGCFLYRGRLGSRWFLWLFFSDSCCQIATFPSTKRERESFEVWAWNFVLTRRSNSGNVFLSKSIDMLSNGIYWWICSMPPPIFIRNRMIHCDSSLFLWFQLWILFLTQRKRVRAHSFLD